MPPGAIAGISIGTFVVIGWGGLFLCKKTDNASSFGHNGAVEGCAAMFGAAFMAAMALILVAVVLSIGC